MESAFGVKSQSDRDKAEMLKALQQELANGAPKPTSKPIPDRLNENFWQQSAAPVNIRARLEGKVRRSGELVGITWEFVEVIDSHAQYLASCPRCDEGTVSATAKLDMQGKVILPLTAEYVCAECEAKLDAIYDEEARRMQKAARHINRMCDDPEHFPN